MTNNKNSNCIIHDAEEKMVGKLSQVDAPNITLAKRIRLGLVHRGYNMMPQLPIELICKFRGAYLFVIIHDAGDIRRDFGVKNQPH
jgi:hypothetical protein